MTTFRITAPIMAISLLLLAVGMIAAWHVHSLQSSASETLANHVASVRAAEELEIGMREVQARLHRFLLTGDERHLEAIPKLRQEADSWLVQAERLAYTPEEARLVTRIKGGYVRFFAEFGRATRPSVEDARQIRELVDTLLLQEILPPAREYLDINESSAEESTAANQILADRLVLALLLLGSCGAVAGLLAGYAVARGVSRLMVQMTVPIHNAAGKLNQVVGPVTLSAGWDFRDLEGILSKLADQVGAVVERLQESQRQVLRSEQLAAVGQLASGIAHELRNPLMAMKLLVQMSATRQRGSPGLRERDLTVLQEEIGRLEQTVQNFLDFARPPRPEPRCFEVGESVRQTVRLVAPRAEQQGSRIDCSLPDYPLALEADVGQFRQVLLNLLLNGLDAAPEGSLLRLHVRVEDGPAGARAVVIEVADDGPGLPGHLGERIFEPFVSTKETGTGLGLAICRRIVEAHGGVIAAANRPEGGSAFTARFPLPPLAA